MASFTLDNDQVLAQETLSVRTITLNRPRQLNALSFEMLSRLLQLFIAYENDPKVKLIILKGKGRAFAAGGDVATVYRHILEGNLKFGAKVCQKLFTLMYLIATYTKPQVSILNGIVLGGGAGISVHGKFRVVTENSIFAMPETARGLFPDVGASYFLSRLPGFFGEYLGLTGARLDGAEMLTCGLATHFVPSTKLSLLEAALTFKVASATSSRCDPAFISAIIDEYSLKKPALKEKSAYHKEVIDKCFSKTTVEEILSALENEATDINRADDYDHNKWLSSTIQSLKMASPMSLISLRSIREGRLQGIGECIVREYRMFCHVQLREISKDFRGGCRAIFWDRDKTPKWEPCKLELINDHMVEHYFTKLIGIEEWGELKLPGTSKLPVSPNAKLRSAL